MSIFSHLVRGSPSQIGRGEPFGQLALLSGCPADAVVTAKEETEVLVVEAGIVKELIGSVAAMRAGLLKAEEALV